MLWTLKRIISIFKLYYLKLNSKAKVTLHCLYNIQSLNIIVRHFVTLPFKIGHSQNFLEITVAKIMGAISHNLQG